jgi:hypothetical protein
VLKKNISLIVRVLIKVADNVCGLLQPGHAPRGVCRRKLINVILKSIYGGTGIEASQSFGKDPSVPQQPMLPVS